MKARKMWSNSGGTIYRHRASVGEGGYPVLVLDASDFPKDIPEPDTKWIWNKSIIGGQKQVEVSIRGYTTESTPRAVVSDGEQLSFAYFRDLKPIPQEATGEVVGTVDISTDDACNVHKDVRLYAGNLPNGRYSIVRRP